MNFFLDECLPHVLAGTLKTVLPMHGFGTAFEEDLLGVDDKLFLPSLPGKGYEAIVTADFQQLIDPEELAACRDAGLHWIGVRRSVPGLVGLALQGGTLTTALPTVIETALASTQPMRFRLQGAQRQPSQLFRVAPL